jgi:hypothetical protein
MAAPHARVAPRQREVHAAAVGQRQHHHAERAPHQVGGPEARERALQPCVVGAVHLEVEVLGRDPEQRVAHAAAHQERALEQRVAVQDAAQRVGQAQRQRFAHE